ncbi:RNA-binding protein Y14 [Linum perenne]
MWFSGAIETAAAIGRKRGGNEVRRRPDGGISFLGSVSGGSSFGRRGVLWWVGSCSCVEVSGEIVRLPGGMSIIHSGSISWLENDLRTSAALNFDDLRSWRSSRGASYSIRSTFSLLLGFFLSRHPRRRRYPPLLLQLILGGLPLFSFTTSKASLVAAVEVDASSPHAQQQSKLKSAITGGASTSLAAPKKTKRRGFREEADVERQSRLTRLDFDSLGSEVGLGPQRC